MRFRIAILSALVLGLLALPVAAFAYAPSGDNFVTCTPDPAAPGDTVECTAGLFDPGTDVEVSVVSGDTQVLGVTLTAGDDGTVDFSFDVPEDAESGEVTITLSGTRDGEPNQVLGTTTIAAGADGDTDTGAEAIADTGADTGILGLAAVAFVALGGGALFLVRRKEDQPVA